MKKHRIGLRKSTSGAVLAEFVVALFPLLAAFFVFLQVGLMVTGKMFTRRANIAAARAAIVIVGGAESNPKMGGVEQGTTVDVENAFKAALGGWGDKGLLNPIGGVEITGDDGSENAALTITTRVKFKCVVPLGKNFVCTGDVLTFEDRSTLPKQGAKYK